jgi:hypothetical protein
VPPVNVDRDVLADALPDLVLLVRRDGILVTHFGGRGLDGLRPDRGSDGITFPSQCHQPQTVVSAGSLATPGNLAAFGPTERRTIPRRTSADFLGTHRLPRVL